MRMGLRSPGAAETPTGYTRPVSTPPTRHPLRRWLSAAQDARELPTYPIPEAARYLRIPETTLRAWVRGQRYVTAAGRRRAFEPVIRLPDRSRPLLSFMNLVEAHVLDALRREHEIPLQTVRKALAYLAQRVPSPHPLADQRFETDGVNLFVQYFGALVNISQDGQLAMRELLQAYLRRVERDAHGIVARLYPFTRRGDPNEPRRVVIDPRISFGRPVLAGTGIPTAMIAERYKAGESVDELAKDYGRDRLEIEEAIRCELAVEAA